MEKNNFKCLQDAAAIAGFSLPEIASGTEATIELKTRADEGFSEDIVKGRYIGEDGKEHSFSTQERNYNGDPEYFAQERDTGNVNGIETNRSLGHAWKNNGDSSAAINSDIKHDKIDEAHKAMLDCVPAIPSV